MARPSYIQAVLWNMKELLGPTIPSPWRVKTSPASARRMPGMRRYSLKSRRSNPFLLINRPANLHLGTGEEPGGIEWLLPR